MVQLNLYLIRRRYIEIQYNAAFVLCKHIYRCIVSVLSAVDAVSMVPVWRTRHPSVLGPSKTPQKTL